MSAGTTSSPSIICGSPEFWPKVYLAYKQAFDEFSNLQDLTNEMFAAADSNAVQDFEKAVYYLARLTMFGMKDVALLIANGSGTGAMKIVRSMFESSALAEYLRLNPHEAKDYIDFGKVITWRTYQRRLGNALTTITQYSPEQVKSIEDGYNSVKARFTNDKGKVRYNWTSKKICEIAEKIGRTKQYKEIYSLCCSLLHANYESLVAYAELKNGDITFDGPPSMVWTSEALTNAHGYSLHTLNTLNKCCRLGFDEKVYAAGEVFASVWK